MRAALTAMVSLHDSAWARHSSLQCYYTTAYARDTDRDGVARAGLQAGDDAVRLVCVLHRLVA